ncbi:hypothetical protein MMC2321_03350 [Chitinophaga sp. MM2321]
MLNDCSLCLLTDNRFYLFNDMAFSAYTSLFYRRKIDRLKEEEKK